MAVNQLAAAIPFFPEIWILFFNPAWCNFIHDPNTEMEFYPLIRTKIEFHPFIRKERYPLNSRTNKFESL